MRYLKIFQKVLHGDLAARNILLSNDNVIKVADFGLSRQLYRDENYMKNSKVLILFKRFHKKIIFCDEFCSSLNMKTT